MHLVVDAKSPLTETAEEIVQMAKEIEAASRLTVTDIVNNTNIGKLTDSAVIEKTAAEVEKAGSELGVPVTMYCVSKDNNITLPEKMEEKKFIIDIKIKMPWEI